MTLFDIVKKEIEESDVVSRFGKTGVSPSTAKTYTDRLRTLIKNDGLDDYLNFIETYPSKDGGKMKQATKISYHSAVLGMIKHSPTFREKYGDLQEKVNNLQRKEVGDRTQHEKTHEPHEGEQVIDDKDWKIANMRAEGQAKLLLKMYELIPPRRADYAAVKLLKKDEISDETDGNYLNVDTMKLYITPLKTGEKFGKQVTQLPLNLVRIVKKSIKELPRRYLFVTGRGGAFASNIAFSRYIRNTLKKLMNKEVGVNALRHYVISKYWKDTPSLQEHEDFASKSGHSVEMSQRYRKKT